MNSVLHCKDELKVFGALSGNTLSMTLVPQDISTQVKCKNPSGKRWGGARDANMPLPKPPKCQLLISSHQFLAAMARNMADKPNQGQGG